MERKTFAFKLADKAANRTSKWKARDGVSIAGCSERSEGDYRDYVRGGDNGYHC
jgi:hypothetical protein